MLLIICNARLYIKIVSKKTLVYTFIMLYGIEGKVIKKEDGFFVLGNGGFLFKVFSNRETLYKIKEGSNIKVFTYLTLKDEKISLFGFLEEGELRFFEMLLSVSGVGPKIALSILDLDTFSNTMAAIFAKKTEILAKAPGVGRKTAERIILELQNKIDPSVVKGLEGVTETNLELVEALVGLGYDRQLIKKVIEKFNEEGLNKLSLEEKLRQALKFLANHNKSII